MQNTGMGEGSKRVQPESMRLGGGQVEKNGENGSQWRVNERYKCMETKRGKMLEDVMDYN